MNLLIFNLKTDADDDVLGFTTDWINALSRHFDKVFVVTMFQGQLKTAPNVAVFSVGKEKGFSEARRAAEFYRILRSLLKKERIDACFAHMMPLFAVMGWPLLKPRRIPIVLWYAHKSVTPLLKVASRLVDRILASSKSGFRIDTDKLRVIGQGIDTERFSPAKRDNGDVSRPFIILTVGRISPIKRIEVLFEALSLLQPNDAGLDIRVEIIGGPLTADDEKYERGLRDMAAGSGIEGKVIFHGSVSFRDVHAAYQRADCFVNSSDTDSVDKTVLEAMACGVPVITSNAAFSEVLPEELNDIWVIPKDDAAVLSVRLKQLISMLPAERVELGSRLRQVVVNGHNLFGLSKKISSEITALVEEKK